MYYGLKSVKIFLSCALAFSFDSHCPLKNTLVAFLLIASLASYFFTDSAYRCPISAHSLGAIHQSMRSANACGSDSGRGIQKAQRLTPHPLG